jgi:hypothetical protein
MYICASIPFLFHRIYVYVDSGDDDCDEDMFEDEPRTTEEPRRIDDPPSELNVPIDFNLEELPIDFDDDIESYPRDNNITNAFQCDLITNEVNDLKRIKEKIKKLI